MKKNNKTINPMDIFIADKRGRMTGDRNENWIALIVGPTGIGKSYTALSLGDRISTVPLTIKKHVTGDPEEFLNRLNTLQWKKGEIIILDEGGVSFGSREWYSKVNKAISKVFQTFRNMNIGVIITVPSLKFIDIHIRDLIHNIFQAYKKDVKNGYIYVKCFDVEHDPVEGTTKHRYTAIKVRDRLYYMPYIKVGKPRKALINAYEKWHTELKKKIREEAEKQVKKKEEPKESPEDTIYNEIKTEIKNYNIP